MSRLKNFLPGALIGLLMISSLSGMKVSLGATSAPTSTELVATENTANLTPEEKLVRAREDLNKALDLALKKVESLKNRLNELNFPEKSQEQILKDKALSQLEAYANYYTRAKSDLGEKDSLDEVKNLALDIKAYRETTYTPGVEEIVSFILVFYNEEVLGVATDRFEKIEADIQKLKELGVIKEADFGKELDQAKSLLQEAGELQGQAKEMILSASSTESAIRGEADEPLAKELIEKSLNNIKTVYSIFLELNRAAKKALGL